ncbi:MAG: nucleotidyltransferase domain-containing protein, partial [Candidatus Magasanikbacteria bacterium]|nr:nucleotidyltransferase domain-containing protein [Candidatus Magasanikbacteria bacterium]
MKLTKKELQTIRKILKQHEVKRAELFGSYARGEAHKRSDVD